MAKNKKINTESSRVLTDGRNKKRYTDTRAGSAHEGTYVRRDTSGKASGTGIRKQVRDIAAKGLEKHKETWKELAKH